MLPVYQKKLMGAVQGAFVLRMVGVVGAVALIEPAPRCQGLPGTENPLGQRVYGH